MKNTERVYINKLRRNTEDSITFFSNSMKHERERSICAAFLRCLGVEFLADEIVAEKNDPPDVIFRHANFEIRELYKVGRRRHDEYRERLKELEQAATIDDVLIPMKWPNSISYNFIFSNIASALSIKAEKYGFKKCSSLDALIYVSLPHKFLDRESETPPFYNIKAQGWRSVSFVIPPYSHVVYCKESTPEFLTKFEGKTSFEWKEPEGFFVI